VTLPDERYRSILLAERLLLRIAAGEGSVEEVREEARSILRHYPGQWDLQQLERAAPHVLQQRMEPLHRMVAAYTAADTEEND
jgi:hypothetical protein